MSLQYSGGTIINRVQSLSTRQDHVNLVTQALLDAGWATISGTPGSAGTTLVVQESAVGNQGQKVRVCSLDPNTGTCAQYFLRHSSGSPTSQTFFASPAAAWRVVATKYHFFSLITGSATRLSSRAFVCGGLLYVPSFLSYFSGDAIAFMYGNGTTDTDATTRSSWRTTLRSFDTSNNTGLFTGLLSASIINYNAWSSNDGGPSIGMWQGGSPSSSTTAYRWNDGTLPAYEPLVVWSPTLVNNEAKIQGQLYDAMVMNDSWSGETAITYDGHTWIAITDQAGLVSVAARNTLFVAVT